MDLLITCRDELGLVHNQPRLCLHPPHHSRYVVLLLINHNRVVSCAEMFEIYCDYAKLLFEACKFRLLSIRFLFFLGKVEKINVHKGLGPAYIMNDITSRRRSGSIRTIY